MPFQGGPLDGQQVTPETLHQADQGGGLDLQALMQGMGGGGPGGPGGPPPGDPAAAAPPSEDLSEADRVQRVLSDLQILTSTDSSWSEQDKSGGQQAMSIVQKILAAEEKMKHDAMGGKIAPQLLSKQFAGAGG